MHSQERGRDAVIGRTILTFLAGPFLAGCVTAAPLVVADPAEPGSQGCTGRIQVHDRALRQPAFHLANRMGESVCGADAEE